MCVAVGSAGITGIMVPVVGNIPGQVVTVAGAESGLQAVACPSATTCVAVGINGANLGVVVPITNGTAGVAQVVSGAQSLTDISCSTASSCLAVGAASGGSTEAVIVPIANGAPAAARLVPGMLDLVGVSCPTVTTCRAVGLGAAVDGAVVSIINGNVQSQFDVTNSLFLLGVACGDVNNCQAVGLQSAGVGLVVPVFEGVPEPTQTVPGTAGLARVGCAVPWTCLAEGESSSTQGVSVLMTTPLPATFSNPVNGEMNVDPTTPFSWSPSPDADGYILVVGTRPQGTDLVNSGVLPATTTNFRVPALPAGLLYATLLTEVEGQFLVYQQVVFTASTGAARFSYPLDGATNVSTTRQFTWTPVAGAQGYILVIGTTLYGTNLANSGVLPATTHSYQVPPLPSGRPLHATLLTKARGAWVNFQAITFTAAP
jgi:hypothetical protein